MDNERENEDELDLKDKIEPGAGDGGGEDDLPVNTDPSTPEEQAYARRLGWVPETEWDDTRAEKEGRRKPAQFVSARDYIGRTQDNLPLMRERLQKQDRQIQDLNGKIAEVHEVVIGQRNMTIEAVKRARLQGIAEAEARMRDAVESGEVGDFDKAKEDRDALLKTPAPAAKPQQRQEQEREPPPKNPEAERWVSANAWINENDTLYRAMVDEEMIVKRKNPGMPITQVLNKAKAKVMERYPELFDINPRRAAPGSVSPPSGARQGRTGFDGLPQADKDEYERQRVMFSKIIGRDGKPTPYTKEEFMSQYALV